MLYQIRKVSEKKIRVHSDRLRISDSNDFQVQFYFDVARPTKKKSIVLETDFKIFKRLWFTPKRHASKLDILKKLI